MMAHKSIKFKQFYPRHKIGGPPRRRIIAADRALRMAGRLPVGNGIAQEIAAEPSGQGAVLVCVHRKLCVCVYVDQYI